MSFKLGSKLAKAGANHLGYLESEEFREKEYDVAGFDNWSEKQWEEATAKTQLEGLAEHAKGCPGCTASQLEVHKEELKEKLKSAPAGTSRQARRRLERLRRKLGVWAPRSSS
jgi:hypothetical protein